nr:hypothetical protein Iba_chr08eCG6450 [Ipomoea batatas]
MVTPLTKDLLSIISSYSPGPHHLCPNFVGAQFHTSSVHRSSVSFFPSGDVSSILRWDLVVTRGLCNLRTCPSW